MEKKSKSWMLQRVREYLEFKKKKSKSDLELKILVGKLL